MAVGGLPAASAEPRVLGVRELESIDPVGLTDLNRLYTNGDFEFGDLSWHWELQRRKPVDYWVELESGRERLWLGVINASGDGAVDFCWRDFDGELRRLAWCASHEPVLELLQRHFQRDWLPRSLSETCPSDAAGIDAGFAVRRAGRAIATGRCRFAIPLIAGMHPPSREPPCPVAVRGTPFVIPVVVDRMPFTVPELLSLEVGAVVRIRRRAFLDVGARLTLEAGDTEIIANVADSKLVVLSVAAKSAGDVNMKERPMTGKETEKEQPAAGVDSAPVDIASMPVDVRFEAARITARYEELRSVRPGFTFELGCSLGEQTIDITANGALIARGELVGIGSELGVRVTTLARLPRAAD